MKYRKLYITQYLPYLRSRLSDMKSKLIKDKVAEGCGIERLKVSLQRFVVSKVFDDRPTQRARVAQGFFLVGPSAGP